MRRERDGRINTSAFSFRRTAGTFLAMITFSGTHMAIYTKLGEWGISPDNDPQLYVNILGGYVLLMASLMTIFTAWLHHRTFGRPMHRLSEAARKVAAGDFSVRIAPMRRDGKRDYVEVMFEDFNRMAEELSGIETLRTDFIANVSHELKTPLAVIQNYATMLGAAHLPEEKRREYAKAVSDATRKLSDLIVNILNLNKLEHQQIFPNALQYNLGEQLRECLLGFEDEWEKKQLVIDTDIVDVTIRADGELLSMVWNNLISNAVKFTGQGGTITVTLQEDADNIAVRVSDTGCGMSPEEGERIFEKFYQADPSHGVQGNGLGLALVKRIIDILGGEITVESTVGKGSTFAVKLRRNTDEAG